MTFGPGYTYYLNTVYAFSFYLTDCKYTCHYKCRNEVRLDCKESPGFKEAQSDISPKHTIVAVEVNNLIAVVSLGVGPYYRDEILLRLLGGIQTFRP